MSQRDLFAPSGTGRPVRSPSDRGGAPEAEEAPAGADPAGSGAAERAFAVAPLAARMRPRNLDEFAGQQHILGPGQLLRRAIEADRIQSLIFYGPPGTGKTSLAQIIARQTQSKFERLSGVESNVADMRRVLSRPPPIGWKTPGSPPFCSSTRSIASTKRSRMSCCPTSRAVSSG